MTDIRLLNPVSPVWREVLSPEEYHLIEDAPSPRAIIVRSADMHGMALPETVLAVGRAGVGVNNIPLDEYAEMGVPVFNTPGANANAVKELVIAALLLASRDIAGGIAWAKGLQENGASVEKQVEKGKKAFAGPELAGKTLGVVGLGAIGLMVANAGVALGMSVTVAQTLGADGAMVRNIVLFGVLIYELVGPALTRIALTEAGDIQPKAEAVVSADD